MKYFLHFFFLFFSAQCAFAHNGILVGKVSDEQSRMPIEFAYIRINEDLACLSASEGKFMFSNLEKGEYTLTISIIGYEQKEIKAIVNEHEVTYVEVTLKPKDIELKEILISGDKNHNIHSLSKVDIKLKPVNSSQELLRIAPGVFIAQHAGGGKAEQIFLRGFDCDHGTDIALNVDGLPVNMVSHAHGQGYADLHFVIPEIVEKIAVNKGAYDVSVGNFATAGAITFQTKNYLEKNRVSIEAGRFGHLRLFSAFNLLGEHARENQQNWYVATEYLFRKSFFQSPDNLNRLNFFTKYQGVIDDKHIISASFSHFNSFWNASGQIPESEVAQGNVSFYGSIDNSEGGKTSRTNANVQVTSTISNHQYFKNQIFFSQYNFDLFSNFTFYLHDKVNGDQIRQNENRKIYGYNGAYFQNNTWGKVKFETQIGANIRMDDIKDSQLSRVKRRNIFIRPVTLGDIQELNAAIYANENITFSSKWGLNLGARFDAFVFNYNNKLDSTGYQAQNVKRTTPSPKLNVFYNLNEKCTFFLNSGVGFHSNDARVVVAQNGLEILPKSFGLDIGTIIKPFSNILFQATLWNLFLQQEFVYVGDEAVVEPSGKTQRTGLDIALRWQLTKGVLIDYDVNYSHARTLATDNEQSIYIPLAPVFTSVGGITTNIRRNLTANVRYRYLGDRPANDANTLVAKGYFLLDANLNYSYKKIEVSVLAENILNTRWKEAQFETESQLQNAVAPLSQIHFTAGTPFSIKTRVSYNF